MLGRLATLAHGPRVLVEALLDGLQNILMLPAGDASLHASGTASLEPTVATRICPIAPQLLAVLLIREMLLQLFAGRTTIRILVSKIDKVLLAKAPPCLNARGHRFGKRHGDAGFVTRKDFLALITPIGNRFEFVDAEDFLRLASDIGELRSTMDRATGWHYHTCEMQFV